MAPILRALGFFALFILLFGINATLIMALMSVGGMELVPDIMWGAGVLTIVEGIISAVMSYHYWDAQLDAEKERIDTDHKYRMELLAIAKREGNGLDREGASEVCIPMDTKSYRYQKTQAELQASERYSRSQTK